MEELAAELEKLKPIRFCTGTCRHAESWHQVRSLDTVKVGCCKVDCQCMEFVPERASRAPERV